MSIKENEENSSKAITIKCKLDATQSKEELKEIEDQIDTVVKKYKEYEKLSGKVNLYRDILITLIYISTGIWMFRGDILQSIFSLILILIIGQVYKR